MDKERPLAEPTTRQTVEFGEHILVIDLSRVTVGDWYEIMSQPDDNARFVATLRFCEKAVGGKFFPMALLYMHPIMTRVMEEVAFLVSPQDLDLGKDEHE